jgi:hypothetical protein
MPAETIFLILDPGRPPIAAFSRLCDARAYQQSLIGTRVVPGPIIAIPFNPDARHAG